VYDISQLEIPIRQYRCQNLTKTNRISECFSNVTDIPAITGFINETTSRFGGIIVESNLSIPLDYNSPLLYFELEFLGPGLSVVVETWDGQRYISEQQDPENIIPELVTGSFEYYIDDVQNAHFVLVEQEDVTLTENTNTGPNLRDFWVSPMPWNYTGTVLFNSSYSNFRILSNDRRGLAYSFKGLDSRAVLIPFEFDVTNVLVSNDINEWFQSSTGRLSVRSLCLDNPAACSWYYDSNSTQIRSLDSQFYICVNLTIQEPVPFVQTTECNDTADIYYPFVSDYILTWRTELLGESDILIPQEDLQSTYTVQLNLSSNTSWPFSIYFQGSNLINDTEVADTVALQSIVLLTHNRLVFDCACPIVSYVSNQSNFNELWFTETTTRSQAFFDVNDIVLAKNYTSLGTERLVRGYIASSDDVSRSSVVEPLKGYEGNSFGAYNNEIRIISSEEALLGYDDFNIYAAPFRCPDGSRSRGYSETRNISVNCNCTSELPITNCNCLDALNITFGCQCNNTAAACECGFPSNPNFEIVMYERLQDLQAAECNCLIDQSLDTDLFLDAEIEGNNATFRNVSYTAIPEQLHLVFEGGDCSNVNLQITSQTPIFTNESIVIDFVETSVPQQCNKFILPLIDLDIPQSQYTITFNGTLTSARMLFSNVGFLINSLDEPVVTASSNQSAAANVLVDPNTFWVSEDGNQAPAWIQYTYNRRFIPDYMVVNFYLSARNVSNNTIPYQIELRGSNDGSQWYLLGIFISHTLEGGFGIEMMNLTTFSTGFDRFMLFNEGYRIGVRTWDLYSKQKCTCDDGVNLDLQVTSVRGLKSLQFYLDDMNFQLENTIDNVEAVGVNECFISINGNQLDVSNDGVCNDVIYAASEFNIPANRELYSSVITDYQVEGYNFSRYVDLSSSGLPAFGAVQFDINGTDFYSTAQVIDFYASSYEFSTPYPEPETMDLLIFYFDSNFEILPYPITLTTEESFYINNTLSILTNTYNITYGDLIESGIACCAGCDLTDCGCSNRRLPIMAGYGCTLNDTVAFLTSDIENRTAVLSRNTYFLWNITDLEDPYTLIFTDISLERKQSQTVLQDCEQQLCTDINAPFKCLNGKCAASASDCDTRYNCAGDGCIEQTDASDFGNFVGRCACKPGCAGDACQYCVARPAITDIPQLVPASASIACGGLPKFRIRPPVNNLLPSGPITKEQLVEINRRVTGNSAPKSDLHKGYFNVMPISGGYGQAIKLQRRIVISEGVINPIEQLRESDCSCARKVSFFIYLF
jgi:hypothetical protein